jgi:hypothetical protein
MPSPEIANALLELEKQHTLSLPMAALILGALSQVEALIELADRVRKSGISSPSTQTT